MTSFTATMANKSGEASLDSKDKGAPVKSGHNVEARYTESNGSLSQQMQNLRMRSQLRQIEMTGMLYGTDHATGVSYMVGQLFRQSKSQQQHK